MCVNFLGSAKTTHIAARQLQLAPSILLLRRRSRKAPGTQIYSNSSSTVALFYCGGAVEEKSAGYTKITWRVVPQSSTPVQG